MAEEAPASGKNARQSKTREEVIAEREAKKRQKEERKNAATKKVEGGGKGKKKSSSQNNDEDIDDNNSAKKKEVQQRRDQVEGRTNSGKKLSENSANEDGSVSVVERRGSVSVLEIKKDLGGSAPGVGGRRASVVETGKGGKQEKSSEKTTRLERKDSEKSSKSAAHASGDGRHPVMLQHDDPKRAKQHAKKAMVNKRRIEKQVPLFSHLPQYERENALSLQVKFANEELHPAFIRLGLKMAEGTISGGNARCVALLNAFKELIRDYQTPPNKVLSLHLHSIVKPLIRFLIDCRPMSVSMGNAVRFVKQKIFRIKDTVTEEQAKEFLIGKIDMFIQERIEVADQAIVGLAVTRIVDGDVILTYAKSYVVEMLLKKAHDMGKKFRVIIADSRPQLEGKEMTRQLVKYGVKCTYILINTLPYVIQEVSKVFLGASAILANGAVLSRVGTAVVGMMAHRHNIPLLVCCETYKMHERVQLDSICFNELGDPDDLGRTDRDDTRFGDVLTGWRDIQKLKLLNLNYDLTPAEFVSSIVTEVGQIPPTSVPVILREYHKEDQED